MKDNFSLFCCCRCRSRLMVRSPSASGSAPVAGEAQPDTSGERLRQLLRAAEELEQAGKQQEAADGSPEGRAGTPGAVGPPRFVAGRSRADSAGHRRSPQVIVHLKVFEVSLTKLRRLGYNLAKVQGKPVASPDAAKDAVIGGFSMVDDGSEAARFFEAMRKDNLAKVIAEPSLVTISGSKAVFNIGGQFPIPRPQKDGSTAMEWQQYGTQVELTPQVQGDHTVRLSIHFRAADLDNAKAARIGKETVPGIRVREFTTSAELHDGQTLAFSRAESSPRGNIGDWRADCKFDSLHRVGVQEREGRAQRDGDVRAGAARDRATACARPPATARGRPGAHGLRHARYGTRNRRSAVMPRSRGHSLAILQATDSRPSDLTILLLDFAGCRRLFAFAVGSDSRRKISQFSRVSLNSCVDFFGHPA